MTVTDPQIWTALGILAAALASIIALTIRTITVQIQALSATMSAKFETVTTKIDGLDRDVQALSVKVFGSD